MGVSILMYTSAAGCVNVISARRRYLLVSTYMVLLATWCVVGPHVVELIQTLLSQEADVPEQLHSPAKRCVAVYLNVPAALKDCATVHVLDVSTLCVPALLQLRAFISVEPLEHTAKPVGGHLQALCLCMSHICVMAVTTALSHISIKAHHCHRGPPHTHRTTPLLSTCVVQLV
jgi:hypothetical protein